MSGLNRHRPKDRGFGTPCWVWTGPFTGSGCPRHNDTTATKRIYERDVGPIPKGFVLKALCKHHDCVNPEHREPVPLGEHLIDGPHWIEEDRGHDTPCWIWQRYLNRKGYGQVNIRKDGREFCTMAHRLVYGERVGPIPKGRRLHHRCRVRACVNPAHMEPLLPGDHQRHHAERMRAALALLDSTLTRTT